MLIKIKVLFFIVLFFISKAHSEILLVPDQNINFEEYMISCKKEGYLCSNQFQYNQIKNGDTPVFNQFLNQLDYSSSLFREQFIADILNILKSEQLSFDQVEMLIKIISQIKDFLDLKSQKQLIQIENQIQESLTFVKSNELSELTDSFIVIYKTALSTKHLNKINSNLLKIKLFNIEYNKSYKNKNFLISGSCDDLKNEDLIENIKWQPILSESCGFTEQFSEVQSKTSNFIENNKSTLITTGVVALGLALFLKNYDVQFNF